MAKVIENTFKSFTIKKQNLSQSAINSIETTTPNLKSGCTYVVLPQIAVGKDVTVNGEVRTSNRFAALELINGQLNRVMDIGMSALRASYVGIAKEGMPKPELKMERRTEGDAKGLYRPVAGQGMRVTTLDQAAPLEIRTINGEKTAIMAAPFAFEVAGRAQYFQPKFVQQPDGRYDMEVDDNLNAKLQVRNDYVLHAVNATEYAKNFSLATACPEVKDYAL